MNEELKIVEVSISRAERDEYLESVQASLDKYDDYFALPVGTHDEIREKVNAASAATGIVKELQSRLEELNKKVEELEKDAARYRWLREEKTDSRYYPLSGRIVAVIEFETESSDISEAIDTAMQANKGK